MSDLSSPVVLNRPDPLLISTTPTWQPATPLSDPAGITQFGSSNPIQAVAFIDTTLPDYQTLVTGVQPGTAVYLLNPNGNELSQISQVLAGYSNLASVQIFSHGSEGALQLGSTSLNTSNLLDYAGILQSWASSFSADGDLLLMGCDLVAAAIGQSFVSQIATLTGADVAASTDLTGHHNLGGDWDLEFATGSIVASDFLSDWAQAAYQHVLVTFAPATNYAVGANPVLLATGDLNGDGYADLATANRNAASVSVLLNNGSGGFAPATNYTVGDSPRFVAIDDLNGDGFADLAVAIRNSASVSVLLNNGSGGFANPTSISVGDGPESVVIGDLNGDGNVDLAVGNNASASVSVLLNNGSGGFASPTNYAVGEAPRSLTLGDLNGDGSADLAVANQLSDSVSVLLNDGNGGFANRTDYAVGDSPQSVTLGDLNGDGSADLAVANEVSDSVSVLLNDGNGGFANRTDYAVGNAPESVAIGDLNGDGSADLAVANRLSDSVSVLLNNGSGGFANPTSISVGDGPESVVIADFNRDGAADLAVALDASVSVLLNNRNTSPVNTVPGAQTTNEDTTLVFSSANGNALSITDDSGSLITTVSVTNGTGRLSATIGSGATITNNGTHSLTLSGTTTQINAALSGLTYTPTANANGTGYTTLTLSTTDGSSTDTDTVTINVSPVNDAPVVVTPLADQSSPEDTALSFTLPANAFSDVDSASLTLSASLANGSALPSWLSFNAGTRTFSGTPPLNFNGTIAIQVTAFDGDESVSDTFDLVITPVNDAPTISAIANQTTFQNTPELITAVGPLAFTIGDVDTAASSLTVTAISNNPALIPNGNIVLSGSGANRTITLTPANNQFGTAAITINVSDGTVTIPTTFTVTVGRNLNGGNGRDSLEGTAGRDRLDGGNGADTLLGGAGDDLLFGGNGTDILDGGTGNNTLTGGNGADIFVLAPGSSQRITDFHNGSDRLRLTGGLTVAQVLAGAVQVGDDTRIVVGGQEVAYLINVLPAQLDASDFVV